MAIIIPPSHYLVHLQLNLLYQFWLHTEVIGQLGPLEWIFNTPTHHKVHHGKQKRETNHLRCFSFIFFSFFFFASSSNVSSRRYAGSNKYCLDKNYGAWLIIWDKMFGTFEAYRPEEEIVYGLVDPVQSFNPLYLQVNSSFIDLFSKLPETDSSNERKKSPFFLSPAGLLLW